MLQALNSVGHDEGKVGAKWRLHSTALHDLPGRIEAGWHLVTEGTNACL